MQTTGELIRLLGYVDDIAATLHRIDATIPTLTPEERERLAEYMRKSDPNFIVVLPTGQTASSKCSAFCSRVFSSISLTFS